MSLALRTCGIMSSIFVFCVKWEKAVFFSTNLRFWPPKKKLFGTAFQIFQHILFHPASCPKDKHKVRFCWHLFRFEIERVCFKLGSYIQRIPELDYLTNPFCWQWVEYCSGAWQRMFISDELSNCLSIGFWGYVTWRRDITREMYGRTVALADAFPNQIYPIVREPGSFYGHGEKMKSFQECQGTFAGLKEQAASKRELRFTTLCI